MWLEKVLILCIVCFSGGADVNVVDTADGSLLMYAAGQREARGLGKCSYRYHCGAVKLEWLT